MLRPEFQRLQKEGATQLCQMSSDQETVIVQIYNIALSKKGKATCFVSDGHHCLKAFIQEENVINSGTPLSIQKSIRMPFSESRIISSVTLEIGLGL